jgi:hemolysin activation/secretion protein
VFGLGLGPPPRSRPRTAEAEKIEKMQDEAYRAKREAARIAKQETFEKAKARLERRIAQIDLPQDTTQRFTVKQVSISGNTLISTDKLLEDIPLIYNASDRPLDQAQSDHLYDLRPLIDVTLQPGRPRQVSARTIQGFTRYLLSLYQKKNYAGIYVYVPKEAMPDGKTLQNEILPVEVLEGTISDVTIRSYDADQTEVEKGYLLHSAVREWSPVKIGHVANQKKLDDFVNLLNLDPDRYVAATVSEGVEPKSLAVRYDIYEADPWHWFWQIDNSGTKDRQWTPRIGLINTNLLGIDDRFSAVYQAPWDHEIDEDYSLYGLYDLPILGPRTRLNLFGGYSQYDVNPEAGPVNFIGNGDFYGSVLRHNVLQTGGWFFDVTGSLRHERSKVTPSLFPSLLGTDLKWWLWGWGLELYRIGDMARSSVGFNRYESWGGESSGTEFNTARAGASSDFSIYDFAASHSQYTSRDKIGRVSSTFRWVGSNERLVPAKMSTFGGMYTVRGYDEYEVVADGGILASIQYEYDLVKRAQAKERAAAGTEQAGAEAQESSLRKLAPLVFFDYGRAKDIHPQPGRPFEGHEEMFSVGVGTLVELGDNFSGGVYYGYPLRATEETRSGKGRLNVGLMLRW